MWSIVFDECNIAFLFTVVEENSLMHISILIALIGSISFIESNGSLYDVSHLLFI
jgi:hypothetical protein